MTPSNHEKRTRLLIADDQVMLISGLAMLLEDVGFEIVGRESDVNKIVDRYKELNPDVLISDVMFDMTAGSKSGLDIADEILLHDKSAKIVMYSQFEDEENMQHAYSQGVKCFITKKVETSELIKAIKDAAEGEQTYPPKVAQQLAAFSIKQLKKEELSPDIIFNEKLLTIFKLMATGRSQAEIALELGMDRTTVSKHAKKISEILGVDNVAEITMMAIKHNLIDVDAILKGNKK